MKKLFLSFIILYAEAFAQNPKIDSLKNILKTDKEDTNKVIHLNNIALQYFNIGSYDSTFHFANVALQIAQHIDFKKGIATFHNIKGGIYKEQGDYVKALDNYFYALKINEEIKDSRKIAVGFDNIGLVYSNQGNYSKALSYYFKALKPFEELKDTIGTAKILGNIGLAYYKQKDKTKTLDYYFKALNTAEKLGKKNSTVAAILGNIGLVYADEKDYPKALDYHFRALKMKEALGDKNGIAIWLSNIGDLYIDTRKYEEAETYLQNALKIDREIGALYNEMDVENTFAKLYEQTGREALALQHYKKAMVIKDTLFNEEKNKIIIRKEMNYEFEKKEAATIAKAEQEKKDLKKDMIIGFTILGLLLLFMFLLFVFRTLRVNAKQRLIMAYNFLRSFVRYPKVFRKKGI